MTKKSLLFLGPFILLNSAVILAALFKTIQVSLGYYPVIGLRHYTLAYFKTVLGDAAFQRTIGYSLYLALVATILALLLGLGMAFILLKTSANHPLLANFFKIPIALPHIIVALMMLQVLSQSGLISRLLYQVGLLQQIDQFPLLIHDKGGIGIICVFLYKEIPYVAVSTLAILKQLQLGYVQVAANLGASPRQIFGRVILPMVQPILATLFIILFCFTFTSFEVPFILGSPAQETIAVTAYNLLTQADLTVRPMAFALNFIMSLICLAVTLLVLGISSHLPGGGRRREKN